MVVITIVAIIAGVVITQFDTASHDQLRGTAQVVASDIAHARNLAVTNNSSYKISFAPDENRYVLTHSGTNTALDTLPTSAFHSASGSTTEHATDLSSLPLGTGSVDLAIVEESDPMIASYAEQVVDIEFGPLGETTRSSRTTIWLSAGTRKARRFIGIEIDPITGLASIGTVQATVPESLMDEYYYEDVDDANPIDSDPIDSDPIDSDPIDSDPIDSDPIDSDPIDSDPIDSDPIDARSIDVDPTDGRSTDLGPAL
ncbi:MAG: hypothetical protein H8E66_31390 [Planctomycetes bacterium]|nr:hypothetical protein [Planctomycetota bacterium]